MKNWVVVRKMLKKLRNVHVLRKFEEYTCIQKFAQNVQNMRIQTESNLKLI